MNLSCGILLHCDGKYLLGHCTNASDHNGWTIFKGLKDADETNEAAAYREFKEETGIDLKALGLKLKPFASYQLKTKKVVVFLCEDENAITLNIKPKCHSMVEPGGFPEIDDFLWMTKEEAYNKVFQSQKFLFK
jgi:predicted NUDIX family NTP pyrophosphohydrolase